MKEYTQLEHEEPILSEPAKKMPSKTVDRVTLGPDESERESTGSALFGPI